MKTANPTNIHTIMVVSMAYLAPGAGVNHLGV